MEPQDRRRGERNEQGLRPGDGGGLAKLARGPAAAWVERREPRNSVFAAAATAARHEVQHPGCPRIPALLVDAGLLSQHLAPARAGARCLVGVFRRPRPPLHVKSPRSCAPAGPRPPRPRSAALAAPCSDTRPLLRSATRFGGRGDGRAPKVQYLRVSACSRPLCPPGAAEAVTASYLIAARAGVEG